MPPIPPDLAADLYEAYRREWAITPLFVQPDLTQSWSELPTTDKHFWKGVVERFERNLAEGARILPVTRLCGCAASDRPHDPDKHIFEPYTEEVPARTIHGQRVVGVAP